MVGNCERELERECFLRIFFFILWIILFILFFVFWFLISVKVLFNGMVVLIKIDICLVIKIRFLLFIVFKNVIYCVNWLMCFIFIFNKYSFFW